MSFYQEGGSTEDEVPSGTPLLAPCIIYYEEDTCNTGRSLVGGRKKCSPNRRNFLLSNPFVVISLLKVFYRLVYCKDMKILLLANVYVF